jgi:tetratricopeptide (TPR) repeat protein
MASLQDRHRELQALLQARDWPAAAQAAARLVADFPTFAPGWVSAGHAALAQGRTLDAARAAAAARTHAGADAQLLDAIGGLFNRAGDQPRALEAYDAAVALAPDSAHFLYNRAAVRRYLGQLDGAEADFDRVIALRPGDYEAWKTRSDLRTQTPERNHVAALEAQLAVPPRDWRGEVQLRYALAKEYEDLGEYARSFGQLRRGAAKRREFLRYDVAQDVATVDWIIEAYPAGPAAATPGASPAEPIFIVGLPRSGTTLAERILGSHSRVRSAGELNHFALCLVEAVRGRTGAAPLPRRELVARSAALDFAALGRDYIARVEQGGFAGVRFIDKMPLNYLYCGLIRRALPQARIVHLVRHPLASCYAMYKTLFEAGYPFSYDLDEIGRYYLGYRRLMQHWQATMPGVIHELAYERLVADQVGETRRLLAFCGLDFEEACVEFHRNTDASTTASAAQVRRPLYDSSVAQWRHYAAQLDGLQRQLAAAGIEVGP